MKKAITLLALTFALLPLSVFSSGDKWYDTFYQYRVPVVVDVKEAGWQVVPFDEAALVASVNMCEEMTYDPLWFAYNQCKVVAVDDTGNVVDVNTSAGFYLVPDSEELFTVEITGKEQTVNIPTEKGAYYLVKFKSQGGGKTPTYLYDKVLPPGSTAIKHGYISSYQPALLQHQLQERECLLLSDGQPLKIQVKDKFVADVKEVSVMKVKIAFLANVKKLGKVNWMMYYQPILSLYLTIPKLRRSEIPKSVAEIDMVNTSAEKYYGKTRYRLASNAAADIWFAETTVKLTPQTPAPENTSNSIKITSAKNEAQSFQIVLRPKRPFEFEKIIATTLRNGGANISSKNISIYSAEYVPIMKQSYFVLTTYLGKIADPLVSLASKKLIPVQGNYIFWMTIKTPADVSSGVYNGKIRIGVKGEASITLPISLTVYDFALPEYSAFHSIIGGNFLAWKITENHTRNLTYHGLSTKEGLKKLARQYFDIRAEAKFYPYSPALYEEIYMKWDPPPQGYNVDAPGNYFKLYDWDFTEYNRILKHYVDDLKVNTFYIGHTNPRTSNVFKHLPGKELSELASSAPHFVMGWQYYRDCTLVAWGKREGDAFYDKSIEITQDQFDHLVLDYYRAIAKNLDKHGWLDYAHILINQSEDVQRIKHFFEVLKSDPLTARIKIVAIVHSPTYFDYEEDGGFVFRDLIDIYNFQADEGCNWWERHHFETSELTLTRDRLWNHGIGTSRFTIDVPGINNRIIGLDVFNRGGSGFQLADGVIFDLSGMGGASNPWIDPTSPWGNAWASYFYPPRKDGPSKTPDYTIIPSLRVMTFRESVEDYDYAIILEDLIAAGRKKGVDVSKGEAVIKDIERFFYSPVHWSQNDAWYLDLRNRMAQSIVRLKRKL